MNCIGQKYNNTVHYSLVDAFLVHIKNIEFIFDFAT